MKQIFKKPLVLETVGYLAVIVLVFQRAVLPPEGWMLFGDDIHRAYYFFREFFNVWISRGIFPWWNPYLFGGTPFIADPIVNLWYPANWMFLVLPLNVAYSWHVVGHLLWAAIGMCALVGSVTGNRFAAWVSGLVFMSSGFFMARTWSGHVDVIAAASWMPWVIYMFSRVLLGESRDRRRIILAGIVFACQLVSGYQTMAFMTVLFIGVMSAVAAIRGRSIALLVRSAVAGVFGIGLAAFHLVPVAEFFRSSIRTYALPYSWISYGSWTPMSLIQMLHPFYFGDQRIYNGPPPNFGEHSAFIGVIGLLLAVAGVYMVWLGSRANKKPISGIVLLGIAAIIAVIFGIWMSLGSSVPVDLQYIAWKIIPMYQYLRIPTRHLILVVFGLSLLSGIGANYLLSRLRGIPLIGWGVALLVVIEMTPFGRHFIEMHPVPEARHEAGLIGVLTGDKEPYRVLQNFGVWVEARDALDFDSVMPYGIFSATGYSPSILRPYYEYIARATGASGEKAMLSHDVQVPYLVPAQAETLDFLNIKYILVPPSHDPFVGNPRYHLIWDDDARKYRLYENTTVYPRFFLSDRSCGNVTVDAYTPNTITLSVNTTCDTTLLSSEVSYPGWVAKIGGKKTRLDNTNNAFRTLFIPQGKYVVSYQFMPTIFVWGSIISLITCVIMIIIWRRK